jgi:hypothetical protein
MAQKRSSPMVVRIRNLLSASARTASRTLSAVPAHQHAEPAAAEVPGDADGGADPRGERGEVKHCEALVGVEGRVGEALVVVPAAAGADADTVAAACAWAVAGNLAAANACERCSVRCDTGERVAGVGWERRRRPG